MENDELPEVVAGRIGKNTGFGRTGAHLSSVFHEKARNFEMQVDFESHRRDQFGKCLSGKTELWSGRLEKADWGGM